MPEVDDVDAEAEEVLNELNSLTENEEFSSSDIRSQSSLNFYTRMNVTVWQYTRGSVFSQIAVCS